MLVLLGSSVRRKGNNFFQLKSGIHLHCRLFDVVLVEANTMMSPLLHWDIQKWVQNAVLARYINTKERKQRYKNGMLINNISIFVDCLLAVAIPILFVEANTFWCRLSSTAAFVSKHRQDATCPFLSYTCLSLCSRYYRRGEVSGDISVWLHSALLTLSLCPIG